MIITAALILGAALVVSAMIVAAQLRLSRESASTDARRIAEAVATRRHGRGKVKIMYTLNGQDVSVPLRPRHCGRVNG